MSGATAHIDDKEPRVNIAIRKPLHRKVKAAAALQGVSIQEFVQRTLESSIPNHLGMSHQNGKNCTNVPVDPAA